MPRLATWSGWSIERSVREQGTGPHVPRPTSGNAETAWTPVRKPQSGRRPHREILSAPTTLKCSESVARLLLPFDIIEHSSPFGKVGLLVKQLKKGRPIAAGENLAVIGSLSAYVLASEYK